MRRLAPLALLAVLLAACGNRPPQTLSRAKTRACLRGAGALVRPPAGDFVATTASNGSFRAYLHGRKGNFVTLDFGADEQEAAEIAAGYDRFRGKNIGLADILYTDRNVTMLWKEHPSDADRELVTKCLK